MCEPWGRVPGARVAPNLGVRDVLPKRVLRLGVAGSTRYRAFLRRPMIRQPFRMSLGFAAAVALGWLGVTLLRPTPSEATSASSRVTPTTPSPPTAPADEKRLWFVYVGSPDCGWSTQPAAREAVKSIESRLRRLANEQGLGFTALGVVTTRNLDAGLDHLHEVGRFDEVSIGGHTSNAITLDYFWNEGLTPSTPQVVVFERVVRRSDRGSLTDAFGGTDIRLMGRATGLSALTAWARSTRMLPPSGQARTELGSATISPGG